MKSKYLIYLIFILVVFAASYLKLTSFYEGNIQKVIDSAEEVAANEPYCIQVNGGNDYKEALALSDFSGKNMRGAEHGNYHAILVIGDVYKPKLLNWSYNKESFLSNVYGNPGIFCSPQRHFAKTLTDIPKVKPEKQEFVYSGMKFSIPSNTNSFTNGVNHLGFSFNDVRGEITPDMHALISVDFESSNVMQAWIYRPSSPNHIVEADGEEYGLKRQNTWYFGDGKKKKKTNTPEYIQYYQESNTQVVSTLIGCPNSSRGECMHTFQRNGWTYTFRYKPIHVSDWRQLEQRVVKLTNSYIVSR